MSFGDDAKKPAETNPNDLPNVRAFQDEFTRQYLQSTEETRPGYYKFLSGTGRYEMDFPAEGVIDENGYFRKENAIEDFMASVKLNNGEMLITTSYNVVRNKGYIDVHLERIINSTGEKLTFEEIQYEDRIIYFTEYYLDEIDKYYIAYIQNKVDSGGLELDFIIDSNVDIDDSDLNEEIKNILQSVKFFNNNEKVNDK